MHVLENTVAKVCVRSGLIFLFDGRSWVWEGFDAKSPSKTLILSLFISIPCFPIHASSRLSTTERRQTLIPFRFVFKGPPGSGKTTFARKIGKIFYQMGLLATNEVVEASVQDMIAGYVGQTVTKTHDLLNRALGKVLFIDEAYRLTGEQPGSCYAAEARDELYWRLRGVPQLRQTTPSPFRSSIGCINPLIMHKGHLRGHVPENVILMPHYLNYAVRSPDHRDPRVLGVHPGWWL